MKIEIKQQIDMQNGVPIEKWYLHIDDKRFFGPLDQDEIIMLKQIMTKCVVPAQHSFSI